MIQNAENTAEILQNDGINYMLLNEARIAKHITFERLAIDTKVPEPTVKNILFGKVKHPRQYSLEPLCEYLGVPIELVYGYPEKKMIETKGIKEDDQAILALKEIYELQIKSINETNEIHINNIRAHYEQHRDDATKNYEMRLADKREIIALHQAENEALKSKISLLNKVIVGLVLLIIILISLNVGFSVFEISN